VVAAKPGKEARAVASSDTSAADSGTQPPSSPLSPLIHGRVRLLILCMLMSRRRSATFTELKQVLDLTDGTLSVHLSKLAAGGLIDVRKEFEDKKPVTLVRMAPEGRRRFRQYVDELRRIVPGL
jgi:DNA-binding transcriptional ArsR family regulator